MGGRMMMGNSVMCRIIGIGYARLKLHDRSIRKLKHVRFVPNLKRNMITLHLLDQIGYNVKIESDEIIIIKGTETITNGLRKIEVFVLDGEVVVGEVGMSINTNIDKTRLWHLRLRHIREKRLKTLDKQSV